MWLIFNWIKNYILQVKSENQECLDFDMLYRLNNKSSQTMPQTSVVEMLRDDPLLQIKSSEVQDDYLAIVKAKRRCLAAECFF